jgi:hypothetical protein
MTKSRSRKLTLQDINEMLVRAIEDVVYLDDSIGVCLHKAYANALTSAIKRLRICQSALESLAPKGSSTKTERSTHESDV